MVRVCVLGGGIVGLSTARVILETQPGTEVVIIADRFSPETTSNVAAGLYRPGVHFAGPTRETTVKWLMDSLDYMKGMVDNDPLEAKDGGIVERSGYIYSTEKQEWVQNHFLDEIMDVHRPCTEAELNLFPGEYKYKYGTCLTTYLIDCSYHLPYLTKKIKSLGGKFVQRAVRNFEELSDDFDVICNCTGLGARDLCKDLRMSPIRGQVFKVKAPWIKNFVYVDYETYIIPGIDYVTLGGTRQFDSWKEEVDHYDAQGIWERCVKALPSLKNAQVVKQLVGWRPYRPTVRVEKETMVLPNGKIIKVVHNYGHGGYGVMSAPGTAIHAASLVKEYIVTKSKI